MKVMSDAMALFKRHAATDIIVKQITEAYQKEKPHQPKRCHGHELSEEQTKTKNEMVDKILVEHYANRPLR